jgi:hypothetical protein
MYFNRLLANALQGHQTMTDKEYTSWKKAYITETNEHRCDTFIDYNTSLFLD